MWKKEEETSDAGTPQQGRPSQPPAPRPSTGREPATIGPSITIKGEVSGDEDLLIQGRIDGSVELEDHAVTVGSDGRVKADITGRIVTVEGEVEGDLRADEQVVLRSSARVEGDITAPRVVLEDGARFKGLVDMGERKAKESSSSGSRTSGLGSSGSASSSSSSSSSGGTRGNASPKDASSSSGKESGKDEDTSSSDKPEKAKAGS